MKRAPRAPNGPNHLGLRARQVKELMTTLTTVQNDIIKSNKVVGKKGKASALIPKKSISPAPRRELPTL